MKNNDYKATITFCNKELSGREKISFKDLSDSRPVNDLQAGAIITVDTWGTVEVHNEYSESKDYTNTVIISDEGQKYNTSSQSFFNAIDAIYDELQDAGDNDPFAIRIIKKQSKNNSGSFLTCALV